MFPEKILSIRNVKNRKLVVEELDPMVGLSEEDKRHTKLHPYFVGYVSVSPDDVCYKDVKQLSPLDFGEKYPQLDECTLGGITHVGQLISLGDSNYYVGFDTMHPYLKGIPESEVHKAIDRMYHELNKMSGKKY